MHNKIEIHFIAIEVKTRLHARYEGLTAVVLTLYCSGMGGTLLVAQLIVALRYMPRGRVFDSRWCHCNFSLI
jgi:hypothetical protein